jgi:hypothetical protein
MQCSDCSGSSEKPEDSAVLAPLLHRDILYRLWRSEQCEQLERMAQSDGHTSVPQALPTFRQVSEVEDSGQEPSRCWFHRPLT